MMSIQSKATALAVAFLLFGQFSFVLLSGADAHGETEPTEKINKANTKDLSTGTEETQEKKHTLYLSLGNEFDTPLTKAQEIFDCSDKVFTVLELENHPLGKHQLSVRWYDPSGTVREHTQYDFNIHRSNTRLWAWLSLSRGFGSGMLQWVNPAAGLEDFIGIWKIDVKIDGKSIGKESFEVSC